MILIGVTGKAYAGKDTIGRYLTDEYGFHRYPMAGPLKAMLDVGLGLAEQHYQTAEEKEAVIPWLGVSYRHAAQTLGTEWGRMRIADDIWVRIAREKFKRWAETAIPGVVVTDCRFENEAQMIRDLGGTVIHVLRLAEQYTAKAHVSEEGVRIGHDDFVIHNDSTIAELEYQVERVLQAVRGCK